MNLEFSLQLDSPIEKLIKYMLSFENISIFLPRQLKSLKIIEKNNNKIITEEIMEFKTVIKNQITQTSEHTQISDNKVNSKILSGPAKGTSIDYLFKNLESGVEVTINVDLHLSLKAKFLSPIIKKYYKHVLMGTLLKIDQSIMENVS